ncbi:MAG: AbrB/MazE/SpoVT family DNA-binding domain-containing protein [Pyrinomonadaceae bacterium]|nr:AbrB/MazE/SpoVT family DNA-binding domain-containing protein [Pyrinomonadaceae bacterium]
MKTQIVKIGNSKGIRIPKPILKQCSLDADVELEVRADGLLIKPAKTPRHNWDAAFAAMAETEEDELVLDDTDSNTGFEKEKWRW